jgi:hypothetical protein
MGDRGNIYVRMGARLGLYMYTHWRGGDIGFVLQTALAKRWRWTDEAYLARIIFCELVKGDEAGETGYGLSVGTVPDNEHPILVVDPERQEIRLVEGPEHVNYRTRGVLRSTTFEGFLALAAPCEWANPDDEAA